MQNKSTAMIQNGTRVTLGCGVAMFGLQLRIIWCSTTIGTKGIQWMLPSYLQPPNPLCSQANAVFLAGRDSDLDSDSECDHHEVSRKSAPQSNVVGRPRCARKPANFTFPNADVDLDVDEEEFVESEVACEPSKKRARGRMGQPQRPKGLLLPMPKATVFLPTDDMVRAQLAKFGFEINQQCFVNILCFCLLFTHPMNN